MAASDGRLNMYPWPRISSNSQLKIKALAPYD